MTTQVACTPQPEGCVHQRLCPFKDCQHLNLLVTPKIGKNCRIKHYWHTWVLLLLRSCYQVFEALLDLREVLLQLITMSSYRASPPIAYHNRTCSPLATSHYQALTKPAFCHIWSLPRTVLRLISSGVGSADTYVRLLTTQIFFSKAGCAPTLSQR